MSRGDGGDRRGTWFGGFETTHWTEIYQARNDADHRAQEALNLLCKRYWRPLYAYVQRSGHTREEAEDLTQDFFRSFLERDALASVHPAGGRFRSFLLACLKHFLANERKRAHAQRRGGGIQPIPLDTGDTESGPRFDPGDPRSPEQTYDRHWALTLIDRAMSDLRADYAAKGHGELLEILKGFLPGGGPTLPRSELAAQRGTTVGAIDVAVHRLRQQFGARLRAHVAQTVSSKEEIDDEIRHLMTMLTL
ncbi:MAG: sigma-70 family RNA polymerase sigma factor [Verrucomicrobiales bacterium]|nr:sigma-70 family RNA polymerase sigma factor [Verrucomicrobiales bacterium]